jgi:putative ATPase
MPERTRSILGRRLVRMAVEDIGLADPQALVICNAAKDAYDYLGRPRANWRWRRPVSISPPRRNRTPSILHSRPRCKAAKQNGSLLPPKHILNAPTKLMKGRATATAIAMTTTSRMLSPARTISRKMGRQTFYDPPERGFEREIRKRLEWWAKLRKERNPR